MITPAGVGCNAWSGLIVRLETDLPSFRDTRRTDQRLQRLHNRDNVNVMIGELPLKFVEPLGQHMMFRENATKSDEGAHHEQAHTYGASGVENAGRHDRAVFGECVGQAPGELQA
jgi:hypothetical protein